MSTLTGQCVCPNPHPLPASGGKVCQDCGREIAKREPATRATITPEELSFARWQIKQHQRMIHEIRQRYGIQE